MSRFVLIIPSAIQSFQQGPSKTPIFELFMIIPNQNNSKSRGVSVSRRPW
jgi:hypothetical protein